MTVRLHLDLKKQILKVMKCNNNKTISWWSVCVFYDFLTVILGLQLLQCFKFYLMCVFVCVCVCVYVCIAISDGNLSIWIQWRMIKKSLPKISYDLFTFIKNYWDQNDWKSWQTEFEVLVIVRKILEPSSFLSVFCNFFTRNVIYVSIDDSVLVGFTSHVELK